MEDKATLVVTASPKPGEQESVSAYLQGVLPLLMGAGGELVKRLQVGEIVNGAQYGMVLVMDFESKDKVRSIFDSDEYKALLPARDRGFLEINISIAQSM